MFRRAVDSLLGTMLLAALLPLVILSVFRARRRRADTGSPAPSSTIGEFQFERAVEAYESLIDTVLEEKRACATSRR